jgi:tetratricopeptide (TPR) repeat protein
MYNQARVRLHAAMRKPPVNPEYRSFRCVLINGIGNIQDQSGKLVEAERTYHGVLTICAELEQEKLLQPNDEVQRGYACVNIGRLRRASGDPSRALLWYERALRVAESLRQRRVEMFSANDLHKRARKGQAVTLDQLGRFDEALRALDALLAREKGPVHPGLQALRLRTQARMPDYRRAIPDADRLAEGPMHAGDRITLALVYGRIYQSAARDKTLTADERSKLQAKCVLAALRAIEIAPVYLAMNDPPTRMILESDPDLAPVRQRPEFKTILAKKAHKVIQPKVVEKLKKIEMPKPRVADDE